MVNGEKSKSGRKSFSIHYSRFTIHHLPLTAHRDARGAGAHERL
jgi:hypothetical protein